MDDVINKQQMEKDKRNTLARKKSFELVDLIEIMQILRSPDGCPWDREQSHKSIRQNMIEECYEAVEAIDKNDNELLCEELGDVLLQVVFHAEISFAEGGFGMDEIISGICKKLIIRHPHIFANAIADTTEEVLDNWDKIKQTTNKIETAAESMQRVTKTLPALMRADKVGKRARKVGFDFPDAASAAVKVREELSEVLSADEKELEEEVGDLLFSAVNLSRACKIEPELALTKATDKFIHRFTRAETIAGGDFSKLNSDEADAIWEQVKQER